MRVCKSVCKYLRECIEREKGECHQKAIEHVVSTTDYNIPAFYITRFSDINPYFSLYQGWGFM